MAMLIGKTVRIRSDTVLTVPTAGEYLPEFEAPIVMLTSVHTSDL